MKLLSLVLVMIAVLGLLTYTNPTMDEYSEFIRKSVVEGVRKEKPASFGQMFSPLLGTIAGSLVATQTVRHDYIFFSLYEAEFGTERLKALGLLKRFVVLETPKAP